ncbi:MAG: MATE family efflux transporter, partial [Planctomycetota bacterium]
LPGFAIGSAAATLAGQYLGAKRPDLARTAVWRCALLAGLVMGSLGALFILQSEWVTSLLTRQPEHLELTPTLLIICGAVQIPFALGIVFRQALRGAGDVKWAMALTWFSTYGVRLPLAYLLSGVDIPLPGDGVLENPMPDDFPASGLVGLWVALCADLAIRGTLFTARFIHGGWTSKRV